MKRLVFLDVWCYSIGIIKYGLPKFKYKLSQFMIS